MMKMKKITACLAAAALALSLTACQSRQETAAVSVDPAKLASELLETVTSDTLSETASGMIPSIYFLEEGDIASASAYASSGTTSCEIAVIESSDAADTKHVEEMLQTRVDNQQELYSSYNQAEAARLDDAIIKSAGAYTVLCVCDDTDAAGKILEEYGF